MGVKFSNTDFPITVNIRWRAPIDSNMSRHISQHHLRAVTYIHGSERLNFNGLRTHDRKFEREASLLNENCSVSISLIYYYYRGSFARKDCDIETINCQVEICTYVRTYSLMTFMNWSRPYSSAQSLFQSLVGCW